MNFVKLLLHKNHNHYSYQDASDVKMNILGLFLTGDLRCRKSLFKKWALDDNLGEECSGNTTALEKDYNYILLTDLYSEEKIPTILKMTRKQFVQVITDWEEKVCKLKPKEVIIRYENDQFIFETTD